MNLNSHICAFAYRFSPLRLRFTGGRVASGRVFAALLTFVVYTCILGHSLDFSSARMQERTAERTAETDPLPKIPPVFGLLAISFIAILMVENSYHSVFDMFPGRAALNIPDVCHLVVGYGSTDLSPPLRA